MRPATRGYLAVIAAATLWGISGAVAKYLFSQRSIDPFLLVQVRMGFSALLLAGTLAIIKPRLLRVSRSNLGYLAVWGILGMAMVQFFYLFTISQTTVATAIFLQYLSPVMTALYAKVVGRQRLGPLLIACLTTALSGSYLLLFGGGGRLLVTPLGLVSGLAAALFMAFYTIYGARGVTGDLSPWTLLCWGLGMGTAFWLVTDAVLWAAGAPVSIADAFDTLSMWGFYLFIAVFATIVPFGLYLSGLKHIPPTQATITGMTEPVVGGLAAFLVLGEALTTPQLGGGALIVLAVCLLQARPASSSRTAASGV